MSYRNLLHANVLTRPLETNAAVWTSCPEIAEEPRLDDRIRENIPRKETVIFVFKQRREMVRQIMPQPLCIHLIADLVYLFFRVNKSSELDNRSRSFWLLLNKLSKRLKRMSKNKYARHVKRMGTSRGCRWYMRLLKARLWKKLWILELSRQLFGTSLWLTTQQPWPEIAQEEEASGDGWCSP